MLAAFSAPSPDKAPSRMNEAAALAYVRESRWLCREGAGEEGLLVVGGLGGGW